MMWLKMQEELYNFENLKANYLILIKTWIIFINQIY